MYAVEKYFHNPKRISEVKMSKIKLILMKLTI